MREEAAFARVVVLVRTREDAFFDYIVPARLMRSLAPGALVVVPFGGGSALGCISEILDESTAATREISDVLDETLWPGQDLVRAGLYVAERYACPAGVAIRAVLLASQSIRTRPVYSLAGGAQGDLLIPASVSRAFQDGENMCSPEFLRRAIGRSWKRTLKPLISSGQIAEKTVYLSGPVARRRFHPRGGARAVHATGLYTDCEEQSVVRPLPYDLTAEQKAACDRILSAPGAYVVFGATGSGKTEVYMNVAKAHLEKGGGAIILIPEISLTPQTVKRFRERFGNDVAVIHSGLNREEKYQEWIKIKTGKARLAVGARSCIFAPIRNLSLVVIDEEHDRAYKQDEDPKYHAREVALFRSPTVVMGSATPSVETFQRARDGEFQLIAMEKRVPGSSFPRTTVVDMREELSAGNRTIFSRALSQAMGSRLSRHEQSILLLNRRGYSTFLLCRDCGHVIKCPWCDVSLVYHSSENRLRCHYCDYVRKLPETCPNCGSRHIRSFGTGTEKVVAEVQRTTPEARVLRMDSDTTRTRGGHELILKAFSERQADILVGTQMVAKGHDIPGVTLVGIINADTSLNFPDFRAAERTYQLIAQVSGRSGRGSLPGEVLIQTYMPDHYAIVSAASLDYHGFYQKEIESRRDLGYPPFGRLMLVSIRGGTAAECEETGKGVVSTLMDSDLKPSLDILGPAPCAVSKVKRVLRWQVLVKARDLSALKGAGRLLSSRFRHDRVAIDIDPENVI